MKAPATSDRDTVLVAQLAAAVSISSFFYYLRHNDLLLYGDAVAHINIARRVFDSQTPGLLQLGTVWLPLPHLLMLPFLVSNWMWQTGVGGSIPSLVAYVFSVVGVFRFVYVALGAISTAENNAAARFAAWFADACFAVNPNLIYLQTTAMSEPVYLAFYMWSLVFLPKGIRLCAAGDQRKANSSLVWAGLCTAGACLVRYDGWFLAAVLSALLVLLAWAGNFQALRPRAKKFVMLAAAVPALWFAYNAAVYRNPLEFANGPYSAKAIEQKASAPGTPAHPGANNPRVAFQYFFKSAEINLAPRALQPFWVAAMLLGTGFILLFQRKLWPVLLFWTPAPFYMLSIAYGGVPVFVPGWWPHSYYNTRYGIEMLPAFAALTAMAAYGLIRFAATQKSKFVIAAGFLALAGVSYAQVFRTGPVSLTEATVNSRTRIALERQLATIFKTFPSDSIYLMYLGDHVGAFQRAGIPLSHVINEGNHRPWKRPSDPEGLWEKTLAHPATYTNHVIALDSDPVAHQVNKSELITIAVIHVSGQPAATVYVAQKSNQPR
jgi:hypothetical protein